MLHSVSEKRFRAKQPKFFLTTPIKYLSHMPLFTYLKFQIYIPVFSCCFSISSSMGIWEAYILVFRFFFNDTATTEIYTLSLHDARPISLLCGNGELLAERCDG